MVSDLTEVLHKHTNIKIIIHGHTHSSHSYFINNTQIICNPHGRFDNNVMENEKFDHDLIIEI
ncbi:hypothetical protein FACS189496_5540 [Bacilli bacterium]|nr:hypothetical protein FACS189496_5540 [Bacilli bacterium]